jgi:hypothetical protein
MRSLASVCMLLACAACGPVLLYSDEDAQPRETVQHDDAEIADAGNARAQTNAQPSADSAPRALIAIRPTDCGQCFELVASGIGGSPPYDYEWDDGSGAERRRLCATSQAPLWVSLTVIDATSARSSAYLARLDPDAAASCLPPTASKPIQRLCIQNPSFEGTPAANFGQPGSFDAPPWSACSNPTIANNTPDIGDAQMAQAAGAPTPTDGNTMVALGENEQASQQLCQSMPGGTRSGLKVDLSRINLSGMTETEAIFLEVWGGIAADCTQRQLLWASEPLTPGWKTYCVPIEPVDFMDQITLRAGSDNTSVMLSYLIMDNLVPVDSCP